MARGNQRDKAREKNQKEAAATVRSPSPSSSFPNTHSELITYLPIHNAEKEKHSTHPPPYTPFVPNAKLFLSEQQTGTEFQRTKEQQAAIMRQKQEEGNEGVSLRFVFINSTVVLFNEVDNFGAAVGCLRASILSKEGSGREG